MFKLKRFLKDYKIQVILGPIFKLIEAIFELIVPIVMANIIDVGIKNNDKDYIIKMGIVLIFLGVFGLCTTLVCQYMASVASQGFGTKLRRELFAHINKLSYKELDELGTSSLITRLTADINQMQVAVAMLIRLVVRAPFLVIGATIMSFTIDVKLACIFLAVIPIIALLFRFVTVKTVPFYKQIQKKLDKTSLITQENLIGARAVRAFAKQDYEKKRFKENVDNIENTAVSAGKISALLNPITSIVLNTAIILIIWFGGFSVYSGTLTQGQIIALVNYMNQILIALVVVVNLVTIFTKSTASASRINEVFETNPSITESEDAISDGYIDAPAVEFRNVSFSYHNNGENSLSEISFIANKAETIGIIGGTGSGKSTLVNLIPRFYDVSSGEILINGVNVKKYKFKALRKIISIVPQKAVLFSGTLRSNIKMSNENITDEKIIKAIEIAQASDILEKLPDGLDSEILQGGKNLSGGQKQRLTIARAVASDGEILILDDSASALDYSTDSKLRTAIKENCDNKTVFIISQRANTVKNADKIIVLSDGKIDKIGTHKELLKNCKEYYEICLSQFSPKELEEEVNRNE